MYYKRTFLICIFFGSIEFGFSQNKLNGILHVNTPVDTVRVNEVKPSGTADEPLIFSDITDDWAYQPSKQNRKSCREKKNSLNKIRVRTR